MLGGAKTKVYLVFFRKIRLGNIVHYASSFFNTNDITGTVQDVQLK